MKKATRLLSWLLLVAMIASLGLTSALAEEEQEAPAEEVTELAEAPVADPAEEPAEEAAEAPAEEPVEEPAEEPAEAPVEEPEEAPATDAKSAEAMILTQPADVTAVSGGDAVFTVEASGDAVRYQWQRSANGRTWSNLSTWLYGAGNTLYYPASRSSNGYRFRVIVTFAGGARVTSEAAVLSVVSPCITAQPADVTAAPGETAQFTVGASGSISYVLWQVSKNNGRSWSYLSTWTYGVYETLNYKASQAADGYLFRALVVLWDGTVLTSDAAKLTVAEAITYPALQEEKTIDLGGESVTVAVDAPEGALPAGAALALEAVDNDAVKAEAESALGIGMTDMLALDIGFGQNIEPAAPVNVTITAEGISGFDSPALIHIPDRGEPELIEDAVFDGSTVSFTYDAFSIYVVGNIVRLKYEFYKGAELITSEIVRDADSLYEPVVVSDYGQTFIGWAYTQNPSASDIKTIDRLKQEFSSAGVADMTEVKIYAVFHEAYYLRYMTQDEAGGEVVLKTEVARTDASAANRTFTIWDGKDEEGNPLVSSGFAYWVDVEGGGTHYNVGSSVTLNKHIDLYESGEGRYWLLFDKNTTDSATYTPPQYLVGTNATTTKPDDPIRNGYSFIGWNTNPNGNGEWWYNTNGANRFGSTLTGDVKLYAQWEPTQTSYTVIFWKQQVTDEANLANGDKKYDFVRSESRTGLTDSNAVLTAADKSLNTGDFQYTTYNAANSDASKTIDAEGTTVLNVYYDRNTYTLTFQATGVYTYTEYTGTSSGNYYIPNGSGGYDQVYLYYNNGKWYRNRQSSGSWWNPSYTYSNEYTGTVYTRSGGGNTWTTIKTITALVDHTISGEFPIVGTNGTTYTAARWKPQTPNSANADGTAWTEVMAYIEVMPHSNVTFHLDTNTRPKKTVNYYVEALAGGTAVTGTLYSPTDNSVVSAGDKKFVLHNSVDYRYNGVTVEDILDLEGFTRLGMDSQYENRNNVNFWIYDTQNDGTLNIYYTRNSYELHFISQGDKINPPATDVSYSVPYQANLSDYGQDSDGDWFYEPTNGKEGYFFAGWYRDADCKIPFEFDQETMPSHNLQLYAKWDTYRVRAVLIPTADNEHNDEVTFDTEQSLQFRIDYGEAIHATNINTAKRPGYVLLGWYYKNAQGEDVPYVFDQPIVRDSPGVDMNYQQSADWANNTYGDNDGKHDNVRGILKIYARWQVEGNKVHVVYEVPEDYCVRNSQGGLVTQVPVDNSAYEIQDSYPITVKDEEPKDYIRGFEFVEWVLLNPDGSESEITAKAGDGKTIDPSYVKEEAITGDNGQTGTRRLITFRAVFRATEENATVIRYNGNGGATGDGSVTINQPVQVNADTNLLEGDAFVRAGYTLIGWSLDQETTVDEYEDAVEAATTRAAVDYASLADDGYFLLGEEVAADNEKLTDLNDEDNTLYAVWAANFYVYHSGVAGGAIEEIPLTRANHTYDLTQHLGGAGVTRDGDTPNVLYGGYYLEGGFTAPDPVSTDGTRAAEIPAYDGSNWTWTTPETTNGTAISPRGGVTYYIKEVPAEKYLQPYFHYTYEIQSGDICTAWLISDLDDLNYNDTGFVVVSENEEAEGVRASITVKAQNSGSTVTLKPETVFRRKGVTSGYLSYLTVFDNKSETVGFIDSENEKLIIQYWVTPDNLIVTSTDGRTYAAVSNKSDMAAAAGKVTNVTGLESTINVYTSD